MERLTEKVFGFVQLKACGNDFCKETCAEHDEEKSCNNCPIQNSFDKLAEYEDLEEQGLLLRLPCKVGDTVYKIINQRDSFDDTVYQIVSATIFELSMIDKIGKTVFLAKAEAEWKLKEMESD